MDKARKNSSAARFGSWVVVGLLAVQLCVFEFAVAGSARFPRAALPRIAIAVAGTLVYLAAIAAVTIFRHNRPLRLTSLAAAAALTLRFYSPLIFGAVDPPDNPREVIAATISPSFAGFLRELSAAEEQYRLRNHHYTSRVDSLRAWVTVPNDASIQIDTRGESGWAARVSRAGTSCHIWVRDPRLRLHAEDVEGSPVCGDSAEVRTRLHGIQTVLTAPSPEQAFKSTDVFGTWLQHRGDDRRSGSASSGDEVNAFSWSTTVGGPVRSSVAIAGNQVFIGAHANGEIVALSLATGIPGFRLRAPNWIHHEPVVTDSLVIFGFGNNEQSNIDPSFLGSPPSGVVAYDRLTGREVWRTNTTGSVMGSPVVSGSVVAIATGAHQALALNADDGTVIWRTQMPDFSPMANPVLVDSLVIVGVEPTSICALGIRSGRRVYCHVLADQSWGAGHASAAIAGDLVLQVYEEDLDGSGGKVDGPVMVMLRRIIGAPPRRHHMPPPDALREQVMVALHWRDGTEAWRVRLGPGTSSATGHTAGTPTVAGRMAFVPSPVSQAVVAVDTRTGKKIWSSRVNPARGSVLVVNGAVIAATKDSGLVVLDARTGTVRCSQKLPQVSDRAGPTLSGSTAVLTLTGGLIMARPISDWLACRA